MVKFKRKNIAQPRGYETYAHWQMFTFRKRDVWDGMCERDVCENTPAIILSITFALNVVS